jgi:hypothetical protein
MINFKTQFRSGTKIREAYRQINVIRRINIEIKKEVVLKINSEVCVPTKLQYFIIHFQHIVQGK